MTIRRISEKKLKNLGGKLPFSTISSAPKKRIRKKPRSKSEFARIYGSKQRVEFVKSLPCAACGVGGYSENAHVAPASEKGTGYKAGYRFVVPLCGRRNIVTSPTTGHTAIGCHKTYDDYRWEFDYDFPDFDAEKAAADTASRWLAAHPTTNEK